MTFIYPLASEWEKCIEAHYLLALSENNLQIEGGLKSVMLAHGYSEEQVIAMQPEEMRSLLADNTYVPPAIIERARRKKAQAEELRDIKYWWANQETVSKPRELHPMAIPEGYIPVHILGSLVIHLSKSGKKTLCKKKIERQADHESLADPMYSLCPRCKSLT